MRKPIRRIRVKIRKLVALSTLCLLVVGGVSNTVFASSNSSQGTITVSPAFVTLTLGRDAAPQYASVSVRNNFSVPVQLKSELRSVDIQNGVLLPRKTLEPALTQISSVSPTNMVLAPHQSINVQVRVTDSPSLSPGGHYMSLLIEQQSVTGGVGLEPAVSVAMFIIKDQGSVKQISVDKPHIPFIAFWPINMLHTVVHNDGNVIVIPRVSSFIYDNNRMVAQGIGNTQGKAVFQQQSLPINISMNYLKHDWLPRQQNLQLFYRFDSDSDSTQFKVYRFWYVPWQDILLLMIVIGLCYWYRKAIVKRLKKLFKIPEDTGPKAMDIILPKKIKKPVQK